MQHHFLLLQPQTEEKHRFFAQCQTFTRSSWLELEHKDWCYIYDGVHNATWQWLPRCSWFDHVWPYSLKNPKFTVLALVSGGWSIIQQSKRKPKAIKGKANYFYSEALNTPSEAFSVLTELVRRFFSFHFCVLLHYTLHPLEHCSKPRHLTKYWLLIQLWLWKKVVFPEVPCIGKSSDKQTCIILFCHPLFQTTASIVSLRIKTLLKQNAPLQHKYYLASLKP